MTLSLTLGSAPNTSLTANGGNSLDCGFGGSGGNVTLTDSSNYTITNTAGNDKTGGCTPTGGSSGSVGAQTVTGAHPSTVTAGAGSSQSAAASSSGGSSIINRLVRPLGELLFNTLPKLNPFTLFAPSGTTNIPNPLSNLQAIAPTDIKPLQSFRLGVENFLFGEDSKPANDLKEKLPGLANQLAGAGLFKNSQTLAQVAVKPLVLEPLLGESQSGVFVIKDANGTPRESSLTHITNIGLSQIVLVKAGESITLTIYPIKETDTVTANYQGVSVIFTQNADGSFTLPLRALEASGRYPLSIEGDPITLVLEVEAPAETKVEPKRSWLYRLFHIFR